MLFLVKSGHGLLLIYFCNDVGLCVIRVYRCSAHLVNCAVDQTHCVADQFINCAAFGELRNVWSIT